jgi:uncharacterized membrane protein
MNKFLIFSVLLGFSVLFGHEGHNEIEAYKPVIQSLQYQGGLQSWMQWIGSFHFIFLHFPIALIAMTVVSELLFGCTVSPIFDYASRFMLISAAIFAVPTAILGLIYRYTASYNGLSADLIWWHMWFGASTAIFAILVACLREKYGRSKLYYACLLLLFLLVNMTGFLGGGVTFGPYQMVPPSLEG